MSWEPPPDPDLAQMAEAAWEAYVRDAPEVVAFDTETSGLMFHQGAFCVTVAWEGEEHYIELDQRGQEVAADILMKTPILVGHNIKFDLQKVMALGLLERSRLTRYCLEDTEALAHLDDEHRPKGLKALAISVLGYDDTISIEIRSGKNKGTFKEVPKETYELGEAKKWAKKEHGVQYIKDLGYDLLPRGTVVPYAIKDARFTFDLYKALKPRIERYDDLNSLYRQEMALTIVFLDMEKHGMGVDRKYVKGQIKLYQKRILKLESQIEEVVGRTVGKGADEFNPQSNPQLSSFFGEVGIQADSFDAEALKSIDHPLARLLGDLRSDSKILNTYFRAMDKESTIDSILHPSVRQHGTVTGRTSNGKETGD